MSENVNNEQSIENRKKISAGFNIFIIILSVFAIVVAVALIFQKRYLSPFWVNGQSMYPTLNKDAVKPNGELYGEDGSSTQPGSKYIDYGVMDKHSTALKGIKRFDIVVCKYSDNDNSDKIKRVVGLPGETIKFGQGSENGSLYVKNGDAFTVVQQPVDNQYVAEGSYPVDEIKLGNDEYYVLGDNRAHSSDSRNPSVGPIKYKWLIGKVVAICAYCEVRVAADGSSEPFNVRHFFPRFL